MLLYVLAGVAVGVAGGYMLRKAVAESKIRSAEERAKLILEQAERNAEAKVREALVTAKEEAVRLRQEVEQELRERRHELQRLEGRLLQKEEALDRRHAQLERREEQLNRRAEALERKHAEADRLIQQQRAELERLSGLTAEEAKQYLLKTVEEEIRHDMAVMIREMEQQAKEEAEKRARNVIGLAIQRLAADYVSEATVSVVTLPSDDMKGRIIGREGRNIRTLEAQTGVDLIIDDTPEAVVLSGFDPVRREIARIALEKLIADGRIHPARIEEMVAKARKEVEENIRHEGEQACIAANVHGLHPELVRLLGRLKYRYSYGQNVLKHSIEVAHIAAMMAAELGCDVKVARRAGLLHDIGKAVDHEAEGTHVEIGVELLRRYRESEEVIHAVECHHGDKEPQTVEAMLVAAADAISAARPGARRESLANYIKRLERLEAIANSFEGVEKAYAIQAGREIRIMVKPDKVDDDMAAIMARNIVKRIESELQYPGQIKVTVIRETRVVEYAK
ncbi:MAG: ribonuclease Y [Limnochordales bacterium]